MTLQKFDAEHLDAAVNKLIPLVPEGDTKAIGVAVDDKGLRAAITAHFNTDSGSWDARAYGEIGWDGTRTIGIEGLHTWR